MKYFIFSTLVLIIAAFSSCERTLEPKEALLITGGHSFDTSEFFDFYLSLEDINVDTISQPAANDFLTTEEGKEYEVYIFYDMWEEPLTEEQKNAYRELGRMGKGFLFMHHTLVSYQDWDEFKDLTGGRFHRSTPDVDSSLWTTYKHDLNLNVRIADPDHPVTSGMDDFQIHDEAYGNLDLKEGIKPLLETDNPYCHPIIGWTNQYMNSKVVYLILGHDKKAYQDEDYQTLVKKSIAWLEE